MNAVTGYVLKKIADAGISRITETLRQRNGKLTTDAEAVESALDSPASAGYQELV